MCPLHSQKAQPFIIRDYTLNGTRIPTRIYGIFPHSGRLGFHGWTGRACETVNLAQGEVPRQWGSNQDDITMGQFAG